MKKVFLARIDEAFAALQKDGVVARANFTCCQTCGHFEIKDEIKKAQKRGAIQGYTFYHMQDEEAVLESRGLYLAYGSLKDGDEAKVARRIVSTLEQFDFSPTWNGEVSTRIFVPLKKFKKVTSK